MPTKETNVLNSLDGPEQAECTLKKCKQETYEKSEFKMWWYSSWHENNKQISIFLNQSDFLCPICDIRYKTDTSHEIC